ncbi:MAG: alanine--tRNA ligase-related protein [Methanomassiliicoccales archaeon]|nr:alanine--tRNA ligase-related protein [Methanomassiliicoccales archaeon]
MTHRLYEADPYMKSFNAIVKEIDGDWILLDRTAFFPGGGGQECDHGNIGGLRVIEVKAQGGYIYHKVPGHRFEIGQEVYGEIDWDRRYELMKGHTGEHILFSSILRESPDIELVKIHISPSKKSLVVRGHVDWSVIARALKTANEVVCMGLNVTENWLERNEVAASNIRAKLEKITENNVRVVKIGEFDQAACAGIHVRNTAEVNMIFVTKISSAKPAGDFEVSFEIGKNAMMTSISLGTIALHVSEVIGAQPEHLVSAVRNVKNSVSVLKDSLKKYARERLRSLVPEMHGSFKIYSGLFEAIDRKTLIDEANRLIQEEKTVCIFVSHEEKALVLLAVNKNIDIDCPGLLNKCLSRFGGRGGGQKHFASGGLEASIDTSQVLRSVLDAVKIALGQ